MPTVLDLDASDGSKSPEGSEGNSAMGFDELFQPLTYSQFFHRYILTNRPCLLRKGLIEHWASRKDWTDGEGKPNIRFFQSLFPQQQMVPVSICDKRYFNSQECVDMPIKEYLDYWEEASTLNNSSLPSKYLKDWHFYRDCPEYKAYETPAYFCSDWLNEFCEREDASHKDDYRFVYLGPAGTWTPLHFDVFGSFSWSANIVGQKHWIFFPPEEKHNLCDTRGQLLYDVEDPKTKGKLVPFCSS